MSFGFWFFFLVWRDDYSKRMMIGFSLTPTFDVRLPSGNDEDFSLNLNVHIRD